MFGSPVGMYNQNLPLRGIPAEWMLDNGFLPGFNITVIGHVPVNSDRFSVNLKTNCGGNQPIALHLNPRLNDNVVVQNTFRSGAWGTEERFNGSPFFPGSNFTLSLTCHQDDIEIIIDGVLFARYQHRLQPREIRYLNIEGNVVLSSVTYRSQRGQPTGNFYIETLPVSRIPAEWPLKVGFNPGSSLVVHAHIPFNAINHAINLKTKLGKDQPIALHVNPRFQQGAVVRNTFLKNRWDKEERFNGLPLIKGSDFTVQINCDVSGFEISYNAVIFARFQHRTPAHTIKVLEVTGDIIVHQIVYRSKQ